MSHSKRCLNSCFRSLGTYNRVPRVSVARQLPARCYAQVALKPNPIEAEDLPELPRDVQRDTRRQQRPREDNQTLPPSTVHLQEHLNNLFSPLNFPPELAHRILTHGSHQLAKYGDNHGLGFVGRRVLESYLQLFLNASSELKPSHDLDEIAAHTLNTNILGEKIGSRWGFGKVVQWTPAVTRRELEQSMNTERAMHRIGLYKVHGDAVAATLGGIFLRFGGSVAHRVFHTRMLPHLLVRGGLPEVFHEEARAVCERMGGEEAQLLLADRQSRTKPASSPVP